MNQEDIIRMAQEAGAFLEELPMSDAIVFYVDDREWNSVALKAFAKLVAEHERSECLKFCDQVADYFPSSGFVGSYIGSKIKDRGQA